MQNFKAGFTLMELMVSVVLIVLIVLFMYGAVASSKLSNDRLIFHDTIEANRTKIFTLLYNDLMQSQSFQTEATDNRHYTLVKMQTLNSLYQIILPHIVYFVNTRSNQLIRLESARPIELPIKYDDQQAIHADVILKDMNDFNIYRAGSDINTSIKDANISTSSSHKSLLIYLNQKKWKKPMLFELSI